MTNKRTPSYWGHMGETEYDETCLGDAIHSYCWLMSPEQIREEGEVVFVGVAPEKIAPGAEPIIAGLVLEQAIEHLDDEYGNPDESTEPTEAMRAAANVFAQVMMREYTPWRVVEVCRETVDLVSWVEEHCPHLLEEDN